MAYLAEEEGRKAPRFVWFLAFELPHQFIQAVSQLNQFVADHVGLLGIPCGAVLDTAEVLADPHLRERETIFDLEHPTRGRFSVIGCPVRLSDSPVTARRAPLKGEHTEDVLKNIAGFTPDEIQQLHEKHVI